jgi:uncharacterized protein YoxC
MTNVFEEITAISTAIIGVALVGLIVLLLMVVGRARAAGKRLEQLIQRTMDDLQPVIARGKEISANLSAVTNSIRGDVEAVSDTVASANESVRAALAATEERLGEFNALLNVVQDEAENLFVSTAAAVRGVRGGAASLSRRRGTDLASVEHEGDAAHGDADEEETEDDQVDEGPATESPAPRIRPRPRHPRAS